VPLDFTPGAFACYRRTDAPMVAVVMRLLDDRGLDTWRDEADLKAGDDWALAIERALGRAADLLAEGVRAAAEGRGS
jgi:predicted RNA-binding Zn ribbon-like protein